MNPFERFTERAKKVLTLAQEEAERSHHSYIGTEHVLLGLLREGEGVAARALSNLGVEIGQVRIVIERILGREERLIIQTIVPTSRVKTVIELAFEEARRLGNNYVGTEHLLLALLIEGDGIAAHLLRDLGADLALVRAAIDSVLAQPPVEESGTIPAEASIGLASRRYSDTVVPPGALLGGAGRVGFLRFLASPALNEIQEEAERLAAEQHAPIGPEHLLLAALEVDPLVRRMLAALGVDAARIGEARRIATPPTGLLELRRAYQARGVELDVGRGGQGSSSGTPETARPPAHRMSQAEYQEFERLRKELDEAERRWRAGDDAAGSGEPGPGEAAP